MDRLNANLVKSLLIFYPIRATVNLILEATLFVYLLGPNKVYYKVYLKYVRAYFDLLLAVFHGKIMLSLLYAWVVYKLVVFTMMTSNKLLAKDITGIFVGMVVVVTIYMVMIAFMISLVIFATSETPRWWALVGYLIWICYAVLEKRTFIEENYIILFKILECFIINIKLILTALICDISVNIATGLVTFLFWHCESVKRIWSQVKANTEPGESVYSYNVYYMSVVINSCYYIVKPCKIYLMVQIQYNSFIPIVSDFTQLNRIYGVTYITIIGFAMLCSALASLQIFWFIVCEKYTDDVSNQKTCHHFKGQPSRFLLFCSLFLGQYLCPHDDMNSFGFEAIQYNRLLREFGTNYMCSEICQKLFNDYTNAQFYDTTARRIAAQIILVSSLSKNLHLPYVKESWFQY